MKSPCYVPEGREGWWGGPDTRLRCRADDKVVFFSEADAQKAANKATNRGEPMKWYRGKCGHLHIARDKKRRLQHQS